MRFALLGAGGFAREVAHVVHSIRGDREDEYLYFSDNPDEWGQRRSFGVVVGCIEDFIVEDELPFVSAVGSPAVRKKLADRAIARGWYPMKCLRHSQSFFGAGEAGNGTVVCSFCSITDNVKIGQHVIVNLNCTIGHDVVIEDYVTLSPHCTISGNVYIKQGAELGSNVTVIPGVTIGENSVIGAGAVATKDIPPNSLAVGIPAKVIKEIK